MSLKSYIYGLFPRPAVDAGQLSVEGELPEFEGLTGWLNSPPLTKKQLAGKTVLVDFWTHSCVNCLRTIPHLRAWHEAYARHGLVIVGVHTPEFGFEKDAAGVALAVERLGIAYPVALDNDYVLWNRYRNRYWPAHYFADARGRLRYHHFGEGGYGHSEAVIRALLREAGAELPAASTPPDGPAPARSPDQTPETYLGFDRLEYLGSPESVRPGVSQRYSAVSRPALNVFYLDGVWEIGNEFAVPREAGARLLYRIAAGQVNLVMEGAKGGSRVEVELDGQPLDAANRGVDVGGDGDGPTVALVKEGRMYNLLDARGPSTRLGTGDRSEKLLELTFIDPGTKVYAFTFG